MKRCQRDYCNAIVTGYKQRKYCSPACTKGRPSPLQKLDMACKTKAWKALTVGSTPIAYKKHIAIEKGTAFRWKVGVVYGRGRL